jgi:hypothetical protein
MNVTTQPTEITTLPTTLNSPFELFACPNGCAELHLTDDFNGSENVADLSPAQIDDLIAQLMAAKGKAVTLGNAA